MVEFDIERLASTSKTTLNSPKKHNSKDALKYKVGFISRPCVIVDRHWRIIFLYIPSFLDKRSLVCA